MTTIPTTRPLALVLLLAGSGVFGPAFAEDDAITTYEAERERSGPNTKLFA